MAARIVSVRSIQVAPPMNILEDSLPSILACPIVTAIPAPFIFQLCDSCDLFVFFRESLRDEGASAGVRASSVTGALCMCIRSVTTKSLLPPPPTHITRHTSTITHTRNTHTPHTVHGAANTPCTNFPNNAHLHNCRIGGACIHSNI